MDVTASYLKVWEVDLRTQHPEQRLLELTFHDTCELSVCCLSELENDPFHLKLLRLPGASTTSHEVGANATPGAP